jgi:hypothetical protein
MTDGRGVGTVQIFALLARKIASSAMRAPETGAILPDWSRAIIDNILNWID